MPTLVKVRSFLRNLLSFRRVEVDLDEEVRSHLQLLTEENIRSGMSPKEAQRAARIELGGIEQVKEQVREERIGNWLHSVMSDCRFGVRQLRKNPSFTAVAVITLGLGIGANATIFSFVQAFLLREPPVEEPRRVMMLCSIDPKGDFMPDKAPVSAPDFLEWRRQTNSYSGIAAANFDSFTLSGDMEPELVPGGQVSADYFQVLGVAPVLGRAFALDEDQRGHTKVALISEDLWRQRFGSDPRAVGRTVKIDGEDHTLIGVVPSRFRIWIFPAQLWIPLDFKPEQLGPDGRRDHFLNVFARLKPGVSQTQAHAELAAIAQRLAAENPESNKGWGANVVPLAKYMADMSNTRPAVTVLMGAVVFVLLIACSNLANLLLARNTSRQREFSIRAALGAGRMRVAQQLLTECLLISLAGAALGLAISVLGVRVLRPQLNWNEFALALAGEIQIDKAVLLFTLAVSVIAVIFFGLAPALRMSRSGPGAGLKENSRVSAGREHRRLQNLLVIGEVALALILLSGAGLFVRIFIEELRVAPGFDAHHLLTASISLTGTTYKDPANRAAFMRKMVLELGSLPGAESAALARHLPFQFPWSIKFTLEGQPESAPNERPSAGHFLISPNYFHTTQIPLLEGREFAQSDNAGSPQVVIVNEAFARKYFPKANPLGRHIKIYRGPQTAAWSEIVGVSANVNEYAGQAAPRPHIFEPLLAEPSDTPNTIKVIVRTRGDPTAFSDALRRAVYAVDKDQSVTLLRTMSKVIQESEQGDDVMAELMATFAGLALVIAAVGVYGLLAYLVGQRTQEFGVRMALGARRGEILRLVIRSGMALILIGAGIGFLISLVLPRVFGASFTGFHVNSEAILLGAPVTVMLVAVMACYIPARRATRVDPMTALRYE